MWRRKWHGGIRRIPCFFTILRVLQVVHISESHNTKEEVTDGGIRRIPCFCFFLIFDGLAISSHFGKFWWALPLDLMGVFFWFVFWDVVGDFRVLTEHVKTRDVGKLFQALISRLEDASQLDRVATEIATLLIENLSSETVSVANPKVLFCFLKTATLGKKKQKVVR